MTQIRLGSRLGRLRLAFRWLRFGVKCILHGDLDFLVNSWKALAALPVCFMRDIISSNVTCCICGWKGAGFYPNVGPGYYEHKTICPKCLCQDRHRSLAQILIHKTTAMAQETKVIEVAPIRCFQQFFLESKKHANYISFDYARFAMEQGDIRKMRYADESCDYFICFHVLEHIREEKDALLEIRRVLRAGGSAVFQVPMDWDAEHTIEYELRRRRETGHVRRYGRDFANRISDYGFDVEVVSIVDLFDASEIRQKGYSEDPIFLAQKK